MSGNTRIDEKCSCGAAFTWVGDDSYRGRDATAAFRTDHKHERPTLQTQRADELRMAEAAEAFDSDPADYGYAELPRGVTGAAIVPSRGPEDEVCRTCARVAIDHTEGRYSIYGICPAPAKAAPKDRMAEAAEASARAKSIEAQEAADTADAIHIATFDPPTVLALLAEVERLRALGSTVDSIKATGGAVEIAGVRIESCDEYGNTETTRVCDALRAQVERVEALCDLDPTAFVYTRDLRKALATEGDDA